MKEIVIRMSEQEYAYMIRKSHIMGDEELYTRHGILTRAFERGTELPKGHGELRDTKTIVYKLTDTDIYLTDDDWNEIGKALQSAEVLVEADKEEK